MLTDVMTMLSVARRGNLHPLSPQVSTLGESGTPYIRESASNRVFGVQVEAFHHLAHVSTTTYDLHRASVAGGAKR